MEYSTKQLHDSLGIDDLNTCRMKSTIKVIHRGLQNQGPPSLNELFTYYKAPRSLRSEDQFMILPPKSRTKFRDNDIQIRGSTYWNVIPKGLKMTENIDAFKESLKPYGRDNITSN